MTQTREKRSERRLPAIRIVPDLPIYEKRDEIAAAIREHQVVIVCGETGSGKSTQIPKICLAAGRGRRRRIGHTQPRRIAARAVAERIAEELGTPLGEDVGYKVRFTDRTTPSVAIKLMTDGILLAETQGDPRLDEYDTLILDEAHERSLNIDFLLGYLKRLLPRRRDLRLVVTSATIDPESFSGHFSGAPIIEVSGRTYPVEIRYRPLSGKAAETDDEAGAGASGEEPSQEDEEPSQEEAVVAAVEELSAEGPGDVLVFLSGEREIRDTSEALRGRFETRLEILPLFGRLSARDQHRVFRPSRKRRVILATNIAETSLTVPGIHFVVDAGLARISRFNPRTKVQRLPIEPVSRASADQRAGRCGRVTDGICIRLYSEDDYESRDRFTPPEILRTNLAAVVLQMRVMRLGDVEDFPFLDPPDARAVREGLRLLQELQAVDERGEPTSLGRRLARFPVDPRIGRMVLAGREEGCTEEALVIAAALSVQDPRTRPADEAEAADGAHARFADPRSDFLAFLRLWDEVSDRRHGVSQSQFRKWARSSHLSVPRLREWGDVYRQLVRICREIRGLRPAAEPSPFGRLDEDRYTLVHRALLTGLLSNVAMREPGRYRYRGASGKVFYVFPGSALFKRSPRWIMAAELVETSRPWARTCARIDPRWIEDVGAHLVERSWSDPWWDEPSGRVLAREKVTFRGLPVEPGRPVDFGRVDPDAAREVFVRDALAAERLATEGDFLRHNRELSERIESLEHRSRRRGIFGGEEALVRFYDERVPEEICDRQLFETWRRRAEAKRPRLLHMEPEDLLIEEAHPVDLLDFPDTWRHGGVELPLEYRFEPGHPEDGVTVEVPLGALAQLRPEPFEWLVPGHLAEKVEALLRTLPKRARKSFLPIGETAAAFLDRQEPAKPSLHRSLRDFLERRAGGRLPVQPFDLERLPPHLRMHFRVIDGEEQVVARGRDLEEIQSSLGARAEAEMAELGAASPWDRGGLTRWDFDALPDTVEVDTAGTTLQAWPVLVEQRESVDLGLAHSSEAAAVQTRLGVARLLLLALPEQADVARKAVSQELILRARALPPCPFPTLTAQREREPGDEVVLAAAASLLRSEPPRSRAAFDELVEAARGRLWQATSELARRTETLLERAAELERRIPELRLEASRADAESQLRRLVFRGFLVFTPETWISRLPHYLHGLSLRCDKAADDPDRDLQRLARFEPLWSRFLAAVDERSAAEVESPPWLEYRYRLEEYRLSLFAQEIKTAVPVSEKRLAKLWDQIA